MSDVLAPLSGLSVLVVEDESLVALMLEDYVKDLGCRLALTTESIGSALQKIENFSPDFVILGVMMIDGEPDFSIADDLASRGIPFIFCSGHHGDVIADRHRDKPFLSKPFGDAELRGAFSRCHLSSGSPAIRPSASCTAATASPTWS
jgi:CheY-like chemotaxis protein